MPVKILDTITVIECATFVTGRCEAVLKVKTNGGVSIKERDTIRVVP
jgi:hypothetical protein